MCQNEATRGTMVGPISRDWTIGPVLINQGARISDSFVFSFVSSIMPIPPEQFYGRSREITPEPSLLSPNSETPTRKHRTTSLPFSSGGVFIEPAFQEAARELKGKFSVVSPRTFLDTYLPDAPKPMPKFSSTPFRNVCKLSSERAMYEPLVCVFFFWLLAPK